MRWREIVQSFIPRPARRVPPDLVAVVVLTCLAIGAALLPVVSQTPLRLVFGSVLVLLLPGWVVAAILFPEAVDHEESPNRAHVEGRSVTGIGRLALSVTLSLLIVSTIGLVLHLSPWRVHLMPILVCLGGFTLVGTTIAIVRRWETPPENRFRVPYHEWFQMGRATLFEPVDRTDLLLTVLLVLSFAALAGTIGFVSFVPSEGEQFTEFYLLTETDDGDLVAGEYPTHLAEGEEASLIVAIHNHEHEEVSYTVVVELEVVDAEDRETVIQRSELHRFDTELSHGETWYHNHSISPEPLGEEMRVRYRLYTDEPSAHPPQDEPYRDLHLWIDVSASS